MISLKAVFATLNDISYMTPDMNLNSEDIWKTPVGQITICKITFITLKNTSQNVELSQKRLLKNARIVYF